MAWKFKAIRWPLAELALLPDACETPRSVPFALQALNIRGISQNVEDQLGGGRGRGKREEGRGEGRKKS